MFSLLHVLDDGQFSTILITYNHKSCYFTKRHKLCGLMALQKSKSMSKKMGQCKVRHVAVNVTDDRKLSIEHLNRKHMKGFFLYYDKTHI